MKFNRVGVLAAQVAAAIVAAAASTSHAATFNVASAAQITTAMQSAMSGDTLIMANGNWTNQNISFAGNGAAGMPIILRA
ncbi:hypothetical protein Pla175_02600 [Pirellulimonas nuda]|uniref:Uncharacterized protein n=1 Tax=Pirellulimonas nuda TaxID=2528009 RepID=A0A518D604_9BACT|nr:hypothetical protein Pla175_02600 [Pirellulimonas nuda]